MEEVVKRGRGRPRKNPEERVANVNEVTDTEVQTPVAEQEPVVKPTKEVTRDDKSPPGVRVYSLKRGDEKLEISYHIQDRSVTLWKNNSGIKLDPQEQALFIEAIRKLRGH